MQFFPNNLATQKAQFPSNEVTITTRRLVQRVFSTRDRSSFGSGKKRPILETFELLET
jgi:hypothetical protein